MVDAANLCTRLKWVPSLVSCFPKLGHDVRRHAMSRGKLPGGILDFKQVKKLLGIFWDFYNVMIFIFCSATAVFHLVCVAEKGLTCSQTRVDFQPHCKLLSWKKTESFKVYDRFYSVQETHGLASLKYIPYCDLPNLSCVCLLTYV